MKYSYFLYAFLIFATAPAFAGINKTGSVVLNGETVTVSIVANSGSGKILIGDEEYKVSGNASNNVDGYRLAVTNRVKTIDKKIQIIFGVALGEQDIVEFKGMVSNSAEVDCGTNKNSMILISDDLARKVIGNCANLSDSAR